LTLIADCQGEFLLFLLRKGVAASQPARELPTPHPTRPRLLAAHDVFVVLIVNFPSKQGIAKEPRKKIKKKPSTPHGARTSKDEAGKGQKEKK
jgi:hypothetical protein